MALQADEAPELVALLLIQTAFVINCGATLQGRLVHHLVEAALVEAQTLPKNMRASLHR